MNAWWRIEVQTSDSCSSFSSGVRAFRLNIQNLILYLSACFFTDDCCPYWPLLAVDADKVVKINEFLHSLVSISADLLTSDGGLSRRNILEDMGAGLTRRSAHFPLFYRSFPVSRSPDSGCRCLNIALRPSGGADARQAPSAERGRVRLLGGRCKGNEWVPALESSQRTTILFFALERLWLLARFRCQFGGSASLTI